mmetsp:Transcript_89348/g.204270  ORF Transcript_89348/g.204270 Transcript_89348/m.204270 type:complete len:137 (+) Transcript_89348:36-446(+)
MANILQQDPGCFEMVVRMAKTLQSPSFTTEQLLNIPRGESERRVADMSKCRTKKGLDVACLCNAWCPDERDLMVQCMKTAKEEGLGDQKCKPQVQDLCDCLRYEFTTAFMDMSPPCSRPSPFELRTPGDIRLGTWG